MSMFSGRNRERLLSKSLNEKIESINKHGEMIDGLEKILTSIYLNNVMFRWGGSQIRSIFFSDYIIDNGEFNGWTFNDPKYQQSYDDNYVRLYDKGVLKTDKIKDVYDSDLTPHYKIKIIFSVKNEDVQDLNELKVTRAIRFCIKYDSGYDNDKSHCQIPVTPVLFEVDGIERTFYKIEEDVELGTSMGDYIEKQAKLKSLELRYNLIGDSNLPYVDIHQLDFYPYSAELRHDQMGSISELY